MFEFDGSPVPLTTELRELMGRAWTWIAQPGSWWTGTERVAIAEVARSHRSGGSELSASQLPAAANDAAELLASTPAATTRQWVEATVAAIDQQRYVELTGLVAVVVAIDTMARLLGVPLEPIPDPEPGTPSHEPPLEPLNRGKAWVQTGRPPVPPKVLAAVPDTARMVNELQDVFYMSKAEMSDPDIRKGGLHRTQIELVAATTSLGNDCFY
jgi:hypothetical protein